jgi:hypothetical protein
MPKSTLRSVNFNPTQFKILIYFNIISVFSTLSPILSHGDVLSDAKQKKDIAARKYYESLRQLGPAPTEAQKKDLQSKILAPAQAGWAQAMNQTFNQRSKEIRQTIHDTLKSRVPASYLPKWILNPSQREKPTASDKTPTPSPEQKLTAAPPPNESPADVGPGLDGSQFPKELEFPGKSKK